MGICSPLRDARDRALDRCYRCIPCLAEPAWRSALGLKVALVALHLVYVGILFLFDGDLIEKTKHEPWYTSLYLLLSVATLVQYFVTSGSSPGYVLDAIRDINETNVTFGKTSASSIKDNLLQAKMEAWLLILTRVSQEEILQEAMQHIGQRGFWTHTPLEHP